MNLHEDTILLLYEITDVIIAGLSTGSGAIEFEGPLDGAESLAVHTGSGSVEIRSNPELEFEVENFGGKDELSGFSAKR